MTRALKLRNRSYASRSEPAPRSMAGPWPDRLTAGGTRAEPVVACHEGARDSWMDSAGALIINGKGWIGALAMIPAIGISRLSGPSVENP